MISSYPSITCESLLPINDVPFRFFGLMLMLTALEADFLFKQFGFIRGFLGKGLFLIFIGTLCLTDGSNEVQLVFAIALILAGLIHLSHLWAKKDETVSVVSYDFVIARGGLRRARKGREEVQQDGISSKGKVRRSIRKEKEVVRLIFFIFSTNL